MLDDEEDPFRARGVVPFPRPAIFDRTEKIDPDPPRFALSANAFAAFSFLPRAGGDVSFPLAFWARGPEADVEDSMVCGGRGISPLSLEPAGPVLLGRV
jgi:hypothetical protein